MTAIALLALCAAAPAPLLAKGPPIKVIESIPATGEQDTTISTVRLRGSNFEAGPQVRYYRSDTGQLASTEKLDVTNIQVVSAEEIQYTLQIGPGADPVDYDIEVWYSASRKGKGTTLFKVEAKGDTQPNDCMYDFEAFFADADTYGLKSDGFGSYVAFGGAGMRLDTNGSMKLERKNDTRFVWIDFLANGACDSDNAQNPAGATGFCNAWKGVDMRIEHQVQEPQGLCSIEPYVETSLQEPEDYSMLQTVKIGFLGGPDSTPLLKELDLNGNGGSTEPDSFILNYGCQGLRIDSANWQEQDRVLITRMDEHTWLFEGERACLTSQLGNIMVNDLDEPIRLNMPFALCIVDVTANLAEDLCDRYLQQPE
jgi:hypothetical protein